MLSNCCKHPSIRDLSQGLGKERHWFCGHCGMHEWRGIPYNAKDWDAYIHDSLCRDLACLSCGVGKLSISPATISKDNVICYRVWCRTCGFSGPWKDNHSEKAAVEAYRKLEIVPLQQNLFHI